ncbi:hypothetical protein ACFYNL_11135 [Streptomyces sp. NPDC007808]|uniref:hypothetical protein n=1 Tax=Streptomyces sp. NPDC007808 TaxID=3364779 RepID=UPI00368335AE
MWYCNYHTYGHAGPVMFALALTGAALLALLPAVDVLGPRRRGEARPRRWPAMAPLALVPFLVLLSLAKA